MKVEPIRDLKKVQAIEDDLYVRNRRNWFMWVLGTNTGLRISDALPLQVRDVQETHLWIREQKTGKRKEIVINRKLARALREYTRGLADDAWLFPSRQGNKHISRGRAYQILREAGRRQGLAHVGSHSMRKTFGYHFYNATKDVVLLQKLFNHADPAETLRYIGKMQDELDEAMKNFTIF